MSIIIEDDKPLPNHTKLDYEECYAKIVLEDMFPEKFLDLVISDKPDLQNDQLNIGIEVTSAIGQHQQEAEALYANMSFKNDERKEKIENQIEKCGAKLIGGILLGAPDIDSPERMFEAIASKSDKLKDYRRFDKQYLFIKISTNLIIGTKPKETIKRINDICSSANPRFDGIYCLSPEGICVFDLIENTFKIREIDSNLQFSQAERARKLVVQGEQ